MTWQVSWSEPALRDMRRLDGNIARRVRAAVQRLAATGLGDLRRMQGSSDEWRLRVGDWRVRLGLETATETITIYRVLHRSEAYRG